MAAVLKSKQEIEKMRNAGGVLADIFAEVDSKVIPGISTAEINEIVLALCKQKKVRPAFLGYKDYPAAICVGVDDIAIHGIPHKQEILQEGQIVSVDIGIYMDGFYADMAKTYPVGTVDATAEKLINFTKLALTSAINKALIGNTVGDISNAMEETVLLGGFSVILDMTGHGIGKNLHEDPAVPCFGDAGTGELLREGMVLAIEAMVNEGSSDLIYEADGWTTRTYDGKRSALFEHTVAVGKKKPVILTN